MTMPSTRLICGLSIGQMPFKSERECTTHQQHAFVIEVSGTVPDLGFISATYEDICGTPRSRPRTTDLNLVDLDRFAFYRNHHRLVVPNPIHCQPRWPTAPKKIKTNNPPYDRVTFRLIVTSNPVTA